MALTWYSGENWRQTFQDTRFLWKASSRPIIKVCVAFHGRSLSLWSQYCNLMHQWIVRIPYVLCEFICIVYHTRVFIISKSTMTTLVKCIFKNDDVLLKIESEQICPLFAICSSRNGSKMPCAQNVPRFPIHMVWWKRVTTERYLCIILTEFANSTNITHVHWIFGQVFLPNSRRSSKMDGWNQAWICSLHILTLRPKWLRMTRFVSFLVPYTSNICTVSQNWDVSIILFGQHLILS